MKNLAKTDFPCWCSVRWSNDAKTPTLIVSIHRDYIKNTWRDISANVALVAQYFLPLGVTASSFHGGLDRDFGFNGALKLMPVSRPDFVEFKFEIPRILKQTERICFKCEGKKVTDELPCLECHGTGHQWTHNLTGAFSRAASLSIMLASLEAPPEEDTSSHLLQILTLNTQALPQVNGVSLRARISPALNKYLTYVTSFAMTEVERAMRETYLYCVENRSQSAHTISDIWAYLDDGRLVLECPGDNASLRSSQKNDPSTFQGYELESHKLHSLAQQFTFLAGLGQLSQLFSEL